MKIIQFSAIILVFGLSGCAGGAAEFRSRPSAVLCQQAQTTSPMYVFYDQLIAELNSRGEDCSNKVTIEVK